MGKKTPGNFKLSFEFAHQHASEAAVSFCQDPRFFKAIITFLKEKLNINQFDPIAVAGGGQSIIHCDLENLNDIITKSINVAFTLHNVDTVIIFHHRDCGAYGGSGKFDHDHDREKDFHVKQLSHSKVKLEAKYPGKKIISVYIDFNDEKTDLEFIVL